MIALPAARRSQLLVGALLLAGVLAACGGGEPLSGSTGSEPTGAAASPTGGHLDGQPDGLPVAGAALGEPGGDDHPDIVAVELTPVGQGRYDVAATVSSPYDSPERYADAWRVLGPGGEVLGVRELAHHHAGEQPFTRSLPGVEVPDGTDLVVVEGRDSENGWGGLRWQVPVP